MNFIRTSILLFCLGFLMVSCGGKASVPPKPAVPAPIRPLKIICFGGGSTAGVGLPSEQAYPALLQGIFESAKLPHSVVNAGIKGESTWGATERITWVLQQHFDVFVLEQGWEDALKGVSTDSTMAFLHELVAAVADVQPAALLMVLYPSRSPDLALRIEELLTVQGAPILLRMPESLAYWQADGLYPNKAGQQKLAADVWNIILSKTSGQ